MWGEACQQLVAGCMHATLSSLLSSLFCQPVVPACCASLPQLQGTLCAEPLTNDCCQAQQQHCWEDEG